jgi:hypothetical protein
MGEQRAQASLLNFLGNLALAGDRWTEADRCYGQALALHLALQDFWGLGISCCNLAKLHAARGDDGGAREQLLRSLAHYRRAGARHGLEACFELLARTTRRLGDPLRAAWCWGVVDQLELAIGKVLSPAQTAQRTQELDALRALVPEAPFGAAHAEGLRVALDDALADTLRDAHGL